MNKNVAVIKNIAQWNAFVEKHDADMQWKLNLCFNALQSEGWRDGEAANSLYRKMQEGDIHFINALAYSYAPAASFR